MPDSLHLLAERVALERDLLVRRVDALDNSIGIELGLAGALALLAEPGTSVTGRVAAVLAACAAVVAVFGLALRPPGRISVGRVTDRDVGRPARVTQRALLDADVRRNVAMERQIERKAARLAVGTVLLVAAVITGAGGMVAGRR